MKIKITILSLVISFLPSISYADTYIENKHGKITWRTCKLFYVYDDYKKDEIIPTIRYIETISNLLLENGKGL